MLESPADPPLGPPAVAPGDGAQSAERGRSGWAPWTAVVGLLSLVGATLLVGAAASIVAVIADIDLKNAPSGFNIGSNVAQEIVLAGVALACTAVMVGGSVPTQLGLRIPRWRAVAGSMALTWIGFLAFALVWTNLLGTHERQNIPEELGADNSHAALIGTAVLVTVFAPICEELFFRGFLFRALRSWRGVWLAAAITGVLFGGVHAFGTPAAYLVPLAVFGFGLCLLYSRTGSLLPGIAVHALNNSLALGVTQGWDWQVPLLMIGSIAVVAAIVLPMVRAGRAAPAAA